MAFSRAMGSRLQGQRILVASSLYGQLDLWCHPFHSVGLFLFNPTMASMTLADPHVSWIFILLKKKKGYLEGNWERRVTSVITERGGTWGTFVYVQSTALHITPFPCHLCWERSWSYSHCLWEGEDLPGSSPQRDGGASSTSWCM